MPNCQDLLECLRDKVVDPELGINIVDLGLVERLEVEGQRIQLDLIMTTPTCPQGHGLADEAGQVLAKAAPGYRVLARLVAHPLWSPERMTPSAKLRLGWAA